MNNKYQISGMTCETCATKITAAVKKIPDVQSVTVSLLDKVIQIESHKSIELKTVQAVLSGLDKYQVNNINSAEFITEKSYFQIYKPLIFIFLFILLVSLSFQLGQIKFDVQIFMNHIMAGFFISLSFFKFLDVKAFSESFSDYDPLALKFSFYGYMYPFIEIILGMLFVSGLFLMTANVITVLVLSITTFGVLKKLQKKSNIRCACAGTGFSLPLSWVTVFENGFMIMMSLFNICHLA